MIEQPGRPLRGATVGFGFIAERGHLPAYRALGKERFDIVAVADVSEARRAAAREAIPGVRTYADHHALLDAEKDLDFVEITTPPARHAEIAHDAFDRGLHVLSEKPLTTSARDARSLLRHARATKRVIYPCHNYKQAPVIKRVREILGSGVVGDVRLVTLQTFRTTHARGVDEWRPDWRREKAHSGGGIAMDHGSHTFYLAFEWLRGFPTSINATMSTLDAHDTEDNFSCSMRFPNGVVSAHLAWTAGSRKVIYSIHGEHGSITVEDDQLEVSVISGEDRRSPPIVTRESISSKWGDASHSVWFESVFANFAKAIETEDYVGSEAEQAVRCVELIDSAYSSARREGREVALVSLRDQGGMRETGT